MTKPRVRIGFADFWKNFPADNFFTRLLARRFEVEVSDAPDFLIYSCFGKTYHDFPGIRIFYTGENVRPDFHLCDWAFTFDHSDHPCHYRLPLYGLKKPEKLIRGEESAPGCLPGAAPSNSAPGCLPGAATSNSAARLLAEKSRFCNFVYGNPRCRKRNDFFAKLSKYKQVDSGGRYLNNVGGPVEDKRAFIAQHKFTIAFENTSYPGYTTEKIVDPMKVHSLPIYWGNPLVHLDFDTRSFLNHAEFESDEALIEKIIELDRDDDKLLAQLRQPCFHGNRLNRYVDPENILDQFETIFASNRRPVARSTRFYFLHRQRHRLMRNAARIVRQAARAIRKE